MKSFLKKVALFACIILPSSLLFSQQASSETLEFKFKGSKVRVIGLDALPGFDLEISQGRYEEYDPLKGKTVKSVNVNGNRSSWSPATLTNSLYETTHSNYDKKTGASTTLFLHIGTLIQTTTMDNVECSGCVPASTSGKCQNARGKCKAETAPGQCSARGGFNTCSETVVVEKDVFSFSLLIEDWVFARPTNVLRYRLRLKAIDDPEGMADIQSLTNRIGIEMPNGGFASYSPNSNTGYITFEIPAWEEGFKFYYN